MDRGYDSIFLRNCHAPWERRAPARLNSILRQAPAWPPFLSCRAGARRSQRRTRHFRCAAGNVDQFPPIGNSHSPPQRGIRSGGRRGFVHESALTALRITKSLHPADAIRPNRFIIASQCASNRFIYQTYRSYGKLRAFTLRGGHAPCYGRPRLRHKY